MLENDLFKRCGTCKRMDKPLGPCMAGHQLQYPLMVTEHDCPDYEHEPSWVPKANVFTVTGLPECADCGYHLHDRCSGKGWIPAKTDPRCEFFRHKNLTCKHALPILQYGTDYRNNRCSLPPEQRSGSMANGKEWCCPNAHRWTSMKCYEPIGEAS